jgi:Cof subfamily protein (haloacid dehalogenase superfamily)
MQVLSRTAIPLEASRIALKVLSDFGIDIWVFTNTDWLISRDDGILVPHERNTIRFDPRVVQDFSPHLANACKIVGASGDAERLEECENVMRSRLGPMATAARSQSYYLDITPPDQNKGVFVSAMARRLGMDPETIATIGDMTNDVPMFRASGYSVAMGNATDEVRAAAKHVTASNNDEGFAAAIDHLLANNEGD